MNTQEEKRSIIGFNPGFGWTKATLAHNGVCFKSVLAPATDVAFNNDLAHNGTAFEVETDQQRWFVGESAELHSQTLIAPRSSDREPWIVRVLLMAALEKLGITRGEVALVTGLPVQWYGRYKDVVKSELCRTLHYSVNGQARAVIVTDCVVVPESYGTLYRAILDEKGALVDKGNIRQQRVGILDVGTFTTNVVTSSALHYAESESRSEPLGMARVYELLQSRVAQQYRDMSFNEAEYAVTEDSRIMVRGELVDISPLITQANEQVAESILATAKSVWGTGDDMVLLVTGGGGVALSAQIKQKFPHARTITSPQMANAEGMYRYALRRFITQ